MKKIVLLKSLYNKKALLYTMNLYLDDYEYKVDEDEKNYILEFENIEDKELKFLKEELNFNSLRFEITDNNKKIREAIISQALGSINVE